MQLNNCFLPLLLFPMIAAAVGGGCGNRNKITNTNSDTDTNSHLTFHTRGRSPPPVFVPVLPYPKNGTHTFFNVTTNIPGTQQHNTTTLAGSNSTIRLAIVHRKNTTNTTTSFAAPSTNKVLTPIVIPVYFHVYRNLNGTFLNPRLLWAQLTALRTAFAPAGITFVLAPPFTPLYHIAPQNLSWPADITTPNTLSLIRSLAVNDHLGGSNTLNIFVIPLRGIALGQLLTGVKDSILIDTGTLPGSTDSEYNMGDTAVHETGHWLGLRHPFDQRGDGVSDTPVSGNMGCGQDGWGNWMEYTKDVCRGYWTPGQVQRMRSVWEGGKRREQITVW